MSTGSADILIALLEARDRSAALVAALHEILPVSTVGETVLRVWQREADTLLKMLREELAKTPCTCTGERSIRNCARCRTLRFLPNDLRKEIE